MLAILPKLILPQRLNRSRTEYHIPINEMPLLCDGIKKSALNNWESGASVPPITGVYSIALCFGVSIDWLCGLSDDRYTEASVSATESAYPVSDDDFKILVPDMVSCTVLHTPGFTDNELQEIMQRYRNIETRRSFWSLEARAYIVVLTRYIKMIISTQRESSEASLTSIQQKRLQANHVELLLTIANGRTPTPNEMQPYIK